MDVGRLASEEAAAWGEFQDVLAASDPALLDLPGLTPEGWSAKDAMFHVGAWMDDCAEQLEAMRLGTFDGRVDTVTSIEERNRHQFERSRSMTVPEVRSFLEGARSRMLDAWRELPEPTQAAWEWFEESGPLHYRKHVRDLRGWALRLSAPDTRTSGSRP